MLVKSPPTSSSNEDGGGGNDDAATRVYKRYKLSDEKVFFKIVNIIIYFIINIFLFLVLWLSLLS